MKKGMQSIAGPEGLHFRCCCTAVLADLCSLPQALPRRVLARQRGSFT